MRILSFDPGETTGIVSLEIINNTVTCIFFLELTLPEVNPYKIMDYLQEARKEGKQYHITIESVVTHGMLNSAKFKQICAYDRITYAADIARASVHLITPEARKRYKIDVPKGVHGKHARDAYRIGVAYAIKEGVYVPTNPDTKN